MQQALLTNDQYKNLSKKILSSIEKQYRIIPINSLKHHRYHLNNPIYITLEYENDAVIAGFEDIEAFAYADTESEAINALCGEIIQIFEDLNEDSDNLGPLPEKWFRYLKELIECR